MTVILTGITIRVCVLINTLVVWAGTFIAARYNETQVAAWCISVAYAHCARVVSHVSKN